jgi:hypothetical protein
MLSLNSNQIQSTVRVESHTDLESTVDYSVYVGTLFVGSIDKFPVWGLDASYEAMIQAGLSKTDCCYLVEQQPYPTLELAAAHLVAVFLAKSGGLYRSN